MKKLSWKDGQIESPFTDEQAADILKDSVETNEFAGILYVKYCQQRQGKYQLSPGQLFWLHKLAMQYFLKEAGGDTLEIKKKSAVVNVKAVETKATKSQSIPAVTQEKTTPLNFSNSVMPIVHSDLDDYGLTPHEFRVYAHIVRRTNGKPDGECFAKQELMASLCEMSVRRVQYALDVLVAAGMVTKCSRKGRTDVYQVAPKSNWVSSAQLAEIQKRQKQTKESI